MKVKKSFSLKFVLIASILIVSACASNSTDKADDNWAENNGIYDTESSDELYEKAKEEGKVIVYSNTSKYKKIKSLFEEEYTGIEFESYILNKSAMEEILIRKNDAEKYIYPYKPEDIMENFLDGYQDDESPVMYFEVNSLYYNNELHDEPPVDNWWDLTEPEWKGKVLLQDPTSDLTLTQHFVSMVQH